MIRQIDTSLTQALTPTKTTPDNAPPSGQFADQLKKAASKATTDEKPAATGTSAHRAQPATDETWRPVAGHDDYAKIITGDRKGQYVNLNRGGRKGEAFTIQEKDGDQYHVYKQDGKDDLWVKVDSSAGAKAANTPKTAPYAAHSTNCVPSEAIRKRHSTPAGKPFGTSSIAGSTS